jgi:uncharacterized protein YfdQ (DUF2303 family)
MEINQALIDAVRVTSSADFAALPPGVKLVPRESFKPSPDMMRGTVRVDSLKSLYDYIRLMGNSETAIFANRHAHPNNITACIDWNGGWGEHTAIYELGLTPEWMAWQGISGKPLGQLTFAEFIEEHLDCIHEPSAAEVLTVATTLSGKRKVEFTNVVNLANGDKSLQWAETTDAKAAGDIRVPSFITLRIPIYRGSEDATTFDIKALFRYRIADGKLSYEVKLIGAEKVAGLAFEKIYAAINGEFEGDPSPPLIVCGAVLATPRHIHNSTTMVKN